MYCANHPDIDATGICIYCDKFFCENCLVNLDGQMVCKDDVPRVVQNIKANVAASAASERYAQPTYQAATKVTNEPSPHNKWVVLFLCFFLGWFGAHRFYVGKVGTAFLYLFTGGGFLIGMFIDFIMILAGNFTDGQGRLVEKL
jgi:hypothetical protein